MTDDLQTTVSKMKIDNWKLHKEIEGRFQRDARKAWLDQGGRDTATVLDLLLFKEVRSLTRDLSMAEVLEKAAYYNQDRPTGLEWYEELYLDFVTAFAVQWIGKRVALAQRVLKEVYKDADRNL